MPLGLAALDGLFAAFDDLRAALDGNDAAAIEAASTKVSTAAAAARAIGAWRSEPDVVERLNRLLPLIEAARDAGASAIQILWNVILPLAMPGVMTGAIISMAHALGETAPLLLIGMVAFVREDPGAPPEGFFDPASALPVQVYNWTQRGDPAFVERASGAIIVLLVFLILMNLIAIILRRRFERRW